jgi:hypothetical protein
MNDDIIVLSLTRKQVDFLIKCLGFTRGNYRLSLDYQEIAYILSERLKEALK